MASVEINRPEKRNSLSPGLLGGIVSALKKFEKDGAVRCVVLSGRGGKAFSSGYDFSFIGERDMVRDYVAPAHPLAAACDAIERFPRPVVAMVSGYAVGGGLELAAACDFIICSADSTFSMPPAKLGIAYPLSGLERIARAAGVSNAKRMLFTAQPVTAQEAFETGLVSEVVSSESLKEKTFETARRIAEGAPLSTEAAKLGLNALSRSQNLLPSDEKAVKKALEKAQASDDFKEGIASVSEKRKPVFKGR